MNPETKATKAFDFNQELADQLHRLFQADALKKARKKYFEILQASPGDLVLDIGCGTCANARALVEAMAGNCRIIGADNSEPMLAIARKNLQTFQYASQISTEYADSHHLPFPDNHFDDAMIIQVLEYSKEPVAMLQEARRILKPGGKLLLVDTDWDTFVWNSSDKDLTRQIVLNWSDHEADGWQGRKLGEYLKRAGFQEPRAEIYVLQEDSFGENSYSFLLARIVTDYLVRSEKMSAAVLNQWIENLRKKDSDGHFFFSLNRYIYLAAKP